MSKKERAAADCGMGRISRHFALVSCGIPNLILATWLLSYFKRPDELKPGIRRVEKRLTGREMDVLRLLAKGMSNKEIARELWITESTVKYHVSNILEKLDVRNRGQAIIYAHRAGLAD